MQLIGKPSSIVVRRIEELRPHPSNGYYFPPMDDDIEFVESIRSRGIIDMPLISTTNVIISGHRRIEAAKKCGFDQIQCQSRQYDNDDMILYDLICSNIMSRNGLSGLQPLYAARVISKLQELCGNSREAYVGDGAVIESAKMTSKELANELGMTDRQMQRIARLTDVPEKLAEEITEAGAGNAATLEEVNRLTKEQQNTLADILELNGLANASPKKIREWITDIKAQANEAKGNESRLEKYIQRNARLEEIVNSKRDLSEEIEKRLELEAQINRLKGSLASAQTNISNREKEYNRQLNEMAKELEKARGEREVEEVEVEVEVAPKDYEEIKAENAILQKRIEELTQMNLVASIAQTSLQNVWKAAESLNDAGLKSKIQDVEIATGSLLDYVEKSRKGAA